MTEVTKEQVDAVNQALVEAATGPLKVSSDQGMVEQHPLTDIIAAQRHLATENALKKPHRGLRFSTFISPGAV